MLTRRYFRLRTLGQLSLAEVVVDIERPSSARPRHLAVLAVLALARRPISRDTLVEMFWGGETESRARHSLSNALSSLRSILGPDAVTARRDIVSVELDLPMEIDALQFAAASESRDDELAALLYGGAFLAGVHVSDAQEFDQWASRERARLERMFLELCERRVPSLVRAGRWSDAVALAERWVETAPRSTPAITALLRTHAATGSASALTGALDAYDRVRASLIERGSRPEAPVIALVASYREQLSRMDPEPLSPVPPVPVLVVNPVVSAVPDAVSVSHDAVPRARGWGRRTRSLMGAAVIGVLALVIWGARHRPAVAAESARPIVAVTSIEDVRGDTSVAWLQAGLPRLIAADLAAMGGVEVVPPSRVRDVVVRLTTSTAARLTEDQAMDVARRVGATWVVAGGVSTAKGGYLLDLTMRKLTNPGEAESFTLLAANPIELARAAAQRLASLLNVAASPGAPRYSGVETANPDAYRHFVRGMLAMDAERFLDAERDLDTAIALDSGFVDAVRARRIVANRLGETTTERALAGLAARFADRLPELDRLTDEIRNLDTLGEGSRALAMSARLVERFPHDPRAYSFRADILAGHGQWRAADSVLMRELALDSLAMVAGDGPCTPCDVLSRLSQIRLLGGDRVGAEASARRWVALQPDLPAAWHNLSATLAAVGRSSESVETGYRFMSLAHDAASAVDFGRTMLASRRYDIVDSLLASWRSVADPVLADGRRDLAVMLARERGQFAASVALMADVPMTSGMTFVRADGLARLGRIGEARALFEAAGHRAESSGAAGPLGTGARAFTWSHALEADAMVRAGDTTTIRALIDSLEHVGTQSYYGRDHVLHHHVRGVMYLAEGRLADAERELRAGEWLPNGWTRTNIELARTQLLERHPADAIATLRDAHMAPLDAMGRYVPHTEIDWWLSRAFAAAGVKDSAAVYAGYVRAAWKNADPAVRARLDSL